ncbi:activity-regulated cytoskeleton associated protein 1-like [Musca vetustissima]|uniref:activity-regulated cytoskeleton associated protein 1-like n=1 Tax=Musca vetustissima TaxID=27455 RepID=UPI002AB5E108|nr:activity-regulated cytoskeleton associated protein 1-like [Musca vetustissima]
MSHTIQMTSEQLEHLIKSLRTSTATEISHAVAELASKPNKTSSHGSIADCPYRYGGERDREIVEEFILSTQTYKDLQGISDEDGLKSLPLLFYEYANTWWQGVRHLVHTWPAALELLRQHFAPPRPAYQIYLELMEEKQGDDVLIDRFLVKKRAILAQLPAGRRHDEITELDMVYGLLHLKYRKWIDRNDFTTFDELMEKGRIVEYNLQEDEKEMKKLCRYCKRHGHTMDNCAKLEKMECE